MVRDLFYSNIYPKYSLQNYCFILVPGTAKWGPTPEFLQPKRPGEIFIHQPGQAHMMMVPEDEWMLAAYAWIEDGLDGR